MAFEVAAGKGRRPRPSMNVTPLVDVVLVLLIIFMIVTPLLTKRFWVHVPVKDDPAEPPPPDPSHVPVVLTLRSDGSLSLNQEAIGAAELGRRLERVFAARGDRTLFFDAEPGARYGRAVEVMDLARGGGALTIAVLTKRH
jgi:biopolymer transport protein TolR